MINRRIKYPNGWEIIERKLRNIEAKMRKAENDPYDRKSKALCRPGLSITHLKSRFIYDLYRRKQMSWELYKFCLDHGYADRHLIAKWKESRQPKSQNEVLNFPTVGKKRSLKRQSREPGNSRLGKFWQGIKAERETKIETKRKKEEKMLRMEEEGEDRIAQEENKQNICGDHLQKAKEADRQGVEEAIKSANEKLEIALRKRQRAQNLMEYADLATKWATLALKIAEATRSSGSPDLAASSYLHERFG